ncbi:MAG: 3'(2'),5'-bisphosphate nucleotidase CysQ [Acinetobacter sp.]
MFLPTLTPHHGYIFNTVEILKKVSQLLLVEFKQYCDSKENFQIKIKEDDSPVTQADLKANQYIIAALQQLTPQIPVVSEENIHEEREKWDRCWMLDPLDGTKEFIHQRPEFTINLSLIERGKTTFAAIAIPAQEMIYVGYLDELPYKFMIQSQQWYRFQHSDVFNGNPNLIRLGLSHRSQAIQYRDFISSLQRFYNVKPVEAGSAFKFCMMLEHEIDLYPRFHPTSEWDTSAGQCLLESIGGGLVDLHGHPFIYNQRQTLLNGSFLAFTDTKFQKIALDCLAHISNMKSD